MNNQINPNIRYVKFIKLLSVIVPVFVAIIFLSPAKLEFGSWIYSLPHLNAIINSITLILLVLAFLAIRSNNKVLHKKLMLTCLILGVIFLISYIIYHSSVSSTIYGDVNRDGILDSNEASTVKISRAIYIILLLSHILLSIIVVPFVLLAFYYALSDRIKKHKQIVKYTLPIWLYVSASGILVYFMISPYY